MNHSPSNFFHSLKQKLLSTHSKNLVGCQCLYSNILYFQQSSSYLKCPVTSISQLLGVSVTHSKKPHPLPPLDKLVCSNLLQLHPPVLFPFLVISKNSTKLSLHLFRMCYTVQYLIHFVAPVIPE